VIAEGAFVRGFSYWIEVPGSIWASLYTIPATKAIILVDEDDTIFSREGGTHRTNLNTRRVFAMVAKLGYIETPENISLTYAIFETFCSTFGTFDHHFSVHLNCISFYPCSKEVWFFRNIVFYLTSIHTFPASNTALDIYSHTPPEGFTVSSFYISSTSDFYTGKERRNAETKTGTKALFQEFSPVEWFLEFPFIRDHLLYLWIMWIMALPA
jgi:hypothetical protein